MERKTGFYWIKYKEEWIVAYFNNYNKKENQSWWSLPEDWNAGDLEDVDFDEIDEKKLER